MKCPDPVPGTPLTLSPLKITCRHHVNTLQHQPIIPICEWWASVDRSNLKMRRYFQAAYTSPYTLYHHWSLRSRPTSERKGRSTARLRPPEKCRRFLSISCSYTDQRFPRTTIYQNRPYCLLRILKSHPNLLHMHGTSPSRFTKSELSAEFV